MSAVPSFRDEDKLSLANGFKVYRIDEGQWQIVTSNAALTVKLPEDLLVSLTQDQPQTVSDFIKKLSGRYDAVSVRGVLTSLLNKKVIYLNGADQHSVPPDSFFQLVNNGDSRSDADFRPANHICKIIGNGRAHDELVRLAREVGFRLSEDTDAACTVILVAADTPNHQLFRDVNRSMSVPSGVPTIFAFIDGRVVRLMRVLPGATACFECMHHRMRAGKTFWREFDAATSGAALWYQDQPAEPVLQAHQLAAATLMQATLMLAGQVHDLHHNAIIELDSYGQAQTRSPVLKLPRCPVCGPGAASQPMPPIYTTKE